MCVWWGGGGHVMYCFFSFFIELSFQFNPYHIKLMVLLKWGRGGGGYDGVTLLLLRLSVRRTFSNASTPCTHYSPILFQKSMEFRKPQCV